MQAVITIPTLNEVLESGNATGGQDMFISTGDSIFFDAAGTRLTSDSSGDLDLYGNLNINSGDYIVPNNAFAFQGSDPDSGLFFNAASSPPRFEFRSTNGGAHFWVEALTNNNEVFVEGALVLGSNGFDGLSNGDINASDIYYDNLIQKSPALLVFNNFLWLVNVEDFSEGIQEGLVELDDDYNIIQKTILTREMDDKVNKYISKKKNFIAWTNDKQICESKLYWFYVSEKEYREGGRECSLNQEWADFNCMEEFGEHFRWDDGRGVCYENKEVLCEKINWQFWRGEQCNTNWMLECAYNGRERNEAWNGESCVFSEIIECGNQGYGWTWNEKGKVCEFDEGRSKREQYNECLKKGREYYWNGNSCQKY